jgi:hypothetical protein
MCQRCLFPVKTLLAVALAGSMMIRGGRDGPEYPIRAVARYQGKSASEWSAALEKEKRAADAMREEFNRSHVAWLRDFGWTVKPSLDAGSDDAAPVLIDLLDDDDPYVRCTALELLCPWARRRPAEPEVRRVIHVISRFPQNEDPTTLYDAIHLLRDLGPRAADAVSWLRGIVKRGQGDLSDVAGAALWNIDREAARAAGVRP